MQLLTVTGVEREDRVERNLIGKLLVKARDPPVVRDPHPIAAEIDAGVPSVALKQMNVDLAGRCANAMTGAGRVRPVGFEGSSPVQEKQLHAVGPCERPARSGA